ncbi:hypothetical protein HPB47_012362 [Ixodes persulcatus]|uniref:Uncharacterized protein n=1 Tax=Ixodes persulcatus TaxID=34615 RepID=A0AC60NTU7_IXOPE|nr:hypothetical protein HPB47_012362 [Ixodes persulcatus]
MPGRRETERTAQKVDYSFPNTGDEETLIPRLSGYTEAARGPDRARRATALSESCPRLQRAGRPLPHSPPPSPRKASGESQAAADSGDSAAAESQTAGNPGSDAAEKHSSAGHLHARARRFRRRSPRRESPTATHQPLDE